ncbi:MAG: P-II family nitrogen regulator [Nitrospira sp.]|nr:P-II family nitrogen regulator [Nitrospira sp.]
MKRVIAILRPEKENDVIAALEKENFYALTKFPVTGRGRQGGVQVGSVTYPELAKSMVMLVVEDQDYLRAVRTIKESAYTSHPGDGKIFIQDVQEVYTIRTGQRGL